MERKEVFDWSEWKVRICWVVLLIDKKEISQLTCMHIIMHTNRTCLLKAMAMTVAYLHWRYNCTHVTYNVRYAVLYFYYKQHTGSTLHNRKGPS